MTTAFLWTDVEVRRALGLRTAQARDDVTYEGVSTDSRTLEPGELYVALVGERFDGHAFVGDAVAAGAPGAVVSHPAPGAGDAVLYPVDDTLEALGRLAGHRRRTFDGPVVAITGSSGKTSTREMVRAALAERFRVHSTAGNLNNRVGLPLTLLDTPPDAEVVVAELGTNEPGEIAALAAITEPDVAVVTTVSESHLEKLGSFQGVMDEKLDLIRGLAPGGRAVVGDSPPELPRQARELLPAVRVAGTDELADPDLRAIDITVDAFGRHGFTWREVRVALEVPGRHAVQNAMVALAVCDMLGVEPEDAARGLSKVVPGPMRGEIRRVGDLTLVVDCYNSNPQSLAAALDLLEARSAGAKKLAVLGTMLELGDRSDLLHRQALADALERGLDLVVATGGFARVATRSMGGAELLVEEDPEAAYVRLRDRLGGHEVVLLKASRGVRLERLIPRFEADFGSGEEA